MEAGSDRQARVSDGEGDPYVPPVITIMGTVEETLGRPAKDAGVSDEAFSGGPPDVVVL